MLAARRQEMSALCARDVCPYGQVEVQNLRFCPLNLKLKPVGFLPQRGKAAHHSHVVRTSRARGAHHAALRHITLGLSQSDKSKFEKKPPRKLAGARKTVKPKI